MSKGPGLFSDIGKKAKGDCIHNMIFLLRWISHYLYNDVTTFVEDKKDLINLLLILDLLTKDYSADQKLTISTYSTAGVVKPLGFYLHLILLLTWIVSLKLLFCWNLKEFCINQIFFFYL